MIWLIVSSSLIIFLACALAWLVQLHCRRVLLFRVLRQHHAELQGRYIAMTAKEQNTADKLLESHQENVALRRELADMDALVSRLCEAYQSEKIIRLDDPVVRLDRHETILFVPDKEANHESR